MSRTVLLGPSTQSLSNPRLPRCEAGQKARPFDRSCEFRENRLRGETGCPASSLFSHKIECLWPMIFPGSSVLGSGPTTVERLAGQEYFSKVDSAVWGNPGPNSPVIVTAIENIAAMTGTVHPTVDTRSNRVNIPLRGCEVFTERPPTNTSLTHSVGHCSSVRVAVREKAFVRHPSAVIAGHWNQISEEVKWPNPEPLA